MRPRCLAFALALVSAARAGHAGTNPCVFRDSTIIRPIHAVGLDDHTLSFCTGVDCWSLDVSSHTLRSATMIRSALADAEAERAAALQRSHADERRATFCRSTQGACRTFRYAFRRPLASDPYLAMNAEATLGTVTLHFRRAPSGDLVSLTLIFDLVHGGELGRFRGGGTPVRIVGTLIFTDGDIYDLRGKRLHTDGSGGASDVEPVLLGGSVVASIQLATGQLVLRDLATDHDRVIELGLKSPTGSFAALLASRDGRQLYAIAGWPFEGEVLAIASPTVGTLDVGASSSVVRRSPPTCRDPR